MVLHDLIAIKMFQCLERRSEISRDGWVCDALCCVVLLHDSSRVVELIVQLRHFKDSSGPKC